MSSLVDSWGEKAHKVMKWKLHGHKSEQRKKHAWFMQEYALFKGVHPSKCQQYGYVWIIIGFSGLYQYYLHCQSIDT